MQDIYFWGCYICLFLLNFSFTKFDEGFFMLEKMTGLVYSASKDDGAEAPSNKGVVIINDDQTTSSVSAVEAMDMVVHTSSNPVGDVIKIASEQIKSTKK